MLKLDQYPFHNKTLSISHCSCHILWFLRDAYSLGSGADPGGVDGVASHPLFPDEKKIKKMGFPHTLS